ncbi:MAG: hypothetical protein MUO76_11880 [Anaerolineaceae bacterium]|nr:hypothetical protein [Anaerolineaceae bacterium]
MTRSGINIAVSGHRLLDDVGHLAQAIRSAGTRIRECFPDQRFQVYSCLAEGSDRLLARELIKALAADLIAVLPLPEKEYLKDFRTTESVQEFEHLKQLATNVITLEQEHTRPHAYQAANHYLIHHCEGLVVIWDGLPARGEGGTGEIVSIARQAGKALLWIQASSGRHEKILIEERLKGIDDC